MIARIFDKSKPINFLIVFFIMILVFTVEKIKTYPGSFSILYTIKQTVIFLVCLANLAVLNFIVNKNNLTQNNSYKILLFSLFFAMLPFALRDVNVMLSNLFVLLAIRRIISLRSLIKVKKKLFDASIYITVASLFYFWSILFLILVFAGLIFYSENKIKNWIIPFIGVATIIILAISFNSIYNSSLDYFFNPPDFSFKPYNTPQLIINSIILIVFGLWSSFFYVKRINKKLKSIRPSYIMILLYIITAIVVVLLANDKDGKELLFLFAPLSIIVTNYIEIIENKWFKEIILLFFFLIPISFQFF